MFLTQNPLPTSSFIIHCVLGAQNKAISTEINTAYFLVCYENKCLQFLFAYTENKFKGHLLLKTPMSLMFASQFAASKPNNILLQ